MKINRIFAISLLIAFAHSMAVSDNVIITGDVRTLPDSTVAMLFQDKGKVGKIKSQYCIKTMLKSFKIDL